MLIEFRKQLLNIQSNKPWYFQGIAGVADLMKIPEPGQTWRGKDKVLSVDCLESSDMQMTFWADLYRKALYDMNFMRYNLPLDKRRFNCTLIVSEIRNLREANATLATANAVGNAILNAAGVSNSAKNIINEVASLVDMTQSLNDKISYLVFQLSDCEFVFDSYPYLESISDGTIGEAAKFNFKIKVGGIREFHQYSFFQWILDDNRNNAKPNFLLSMYMDGYDTKKYPWYYFTKSLQDNYSEKLKTSLNSLLKNLKGYNMTYLNQVAAFYDGEMSLSGALDTTAQLFQAKHDWAVKNIATIKNVFYDVTGGKIGSNEPPPELSIKNVFDPKSNQISVRSEPTAKDLTGVIRTDSSGKTFVNIGGGQEQSFKDRVQAEDTQMKQDLKGTLVNGVINMGYTLVDKDTTINPLTFILPTHGAIKPITLTKTDKDTTLGKLEFNKVSYDNNLTKLDLKVADKDTTINKISLEKTDKDYSITPIKLDIADKNTQMGQVKLEATDKDSTIIPIKLQKPDVDKTITPIVLTKPDSNNSVSAIKLDVTDKNTTINPIKFDSSSEGNYANISNITLSKAASDNILNPIQLEKAAVNNQINKITFEGAEAMKPISKVKFDLVDKDTTITPLKFDKIAKDTAIKPIKFTEPAVDKNITPIKFTEPAVDNAIKPIKLSEPPVDKTITPLKFDKIAKDNTIKPLTFTKVAKDETINPIKLTKADE